MNTSRVLPGTVAVLVATDLVGGVLAVASDVNTWGEAWGGEALLAAPPPMIAVQVLPHLGRRTSCRTRRRRRGRPATGCCMRLFRGRYERGERTALRYV